MRFSSRWQLRQLRCIRQHFRKRYHFARKPCTEMWPGNTADVTVLLPVIDRLRQRFGIGRVRFNGGIHNKAARCELRRGLPVGFVWGQSMGHQKVETSARMTAKL